MKKAKATLKNENEKHHLMEFFYAFSKSDIISGATILEKPFLKSETKGDFTFNFKVCYSLKKTATFNQLKTEVEKISQHWRWSGDVTYKLTKFHLIKSPQLVTT